MKNEESIGIILQEGEPTFIQWFAVHYPDTSKMLFKRYLQDIATKRAIKRNNS